MCVFVRVVDNKVFIIYNFFFFQFLSENFISFNRSSRVPYEKILRPTIFFSTLLFYITQFFAVTSVIGTRICMYRFSFLTSSCCTLAASSVVGLFACGPMAATAPAVTDDELTKHMISRRCSFCLSLSRSGRKRKISCFAPRRTRGFVFMDVHRRYVNLFRPEEVHR